MAEGDTILRLARRIEAELAGQELSAAAPNRRGRAAGVERLDGRRLERAEARGKHLLLHFDDLVLHSHLGMSGGWHLYERGASWRRSRTAAWAVLAGAEREAVQFGGTTLRLLPAARLRTDPQLARLGPDILAADFDPAAVIAALRAEPERTLGDALLDQRLLAGVGNIFKSEGCFAAAVDPWRRLAEVSDRALEAVLRATREEMLKAVATGRHAPGIYRRRGPCPRCGARVLARGQGDANRTTYWCPSCQR
ncbi:MAG TPA: DNA-formamidopyrimidine glycosylase family protein [Solirubrobacterales bacterium]|jgi:endonuclease-8|nr:DNA-formamidopyrimidine glycosylase family protein [Solirubrobacterales bacterium]